MKKTFSLSRILPRIIPRILFAATLLLGAFAVVVTLSGATTTNSNPASDLAPASDSNSDNPDISLSPYFQVKGAEAGVDALPLKSTQVDAVIAGVIAEVRVVQTYQNEGATPLDARYIFPASTRAAVHGMTMTVGGRRIEAQIKEKNEARKIYDTARRSGKTASLLESHRANVFEMNAANILPGDTVTVELRYNELITPDEGQYEWVFPTVVGPRYTRNVAQAAESVQGRANPPGEPMQEAPMQAPMPGTTTAHRDGSPYPATDAPPGIPYTKNRGAENEPVFTLTADVLSGSRTGVKKIACPSHNITTAGIGGGVRVTLPPGEDPAMNRDFILRYRLAGDALGAGLLADEFKGQRYFLLTVQPPARVTPAMVPPRDYLFVMDVSGSMDGFPLTVSVALLREMLLNLRAQDTFNVLLFAGASRVLFENPAAATPENIAAALALFERNDISGGGTELLPALKRALAMPRASTGASRNIVVMTDGYVDVEAEAFALVRQNIGDANLFAFGIGTAVNRELMERLARAGGSDAVIVDNARRAPAAAEKFRNMIESPVLTRVRVETRDRVTGAALPVALPDVLSQRPIVLCENAADLSPSWDGVFHISGQTAGGPWSADVRAEDAADLGGRGTLALLWARERLRDLEDLHALRVDAEKQKNAIVALGLEYNLLTPFTSFVAVDMTPRLTEEAAAQAKKVTQALPLPQGVSERAVGAGAGTDAGAGVAGMSESGDGNGDEVDVPTSPEPETWALIIVAALVAGALWLRRKREWRFGKESA